jgi:phosphoserine phosphatase
VARLWVELGTADLSGATAYSDSVSDMPLLTAAGRPVAVNPDRRLRRQARSNGWPVLTF